MIVLDNNTRSLQVVLAGAKNTNDCPFVASYLDEPVSSTSAKAAASSNPNNTNGVTAVTILAAPGLAPSWRRRLLSFNLNNADLAAITVSIQYNDNGTTYNLYKATLQTLEQLQYEEGYGFTCVDANGAAKSQAAATSSATSTAQLLATSAWSVLTQINAPASVLSTSVQASSLAAAIVPASVNSVSSQASSLAGGIVIASLNSVSSIASLAVLVSSLHSLESIQSYTATNWATVSSATSRVKSSFSW